jgi:isopenicillin N synthase-like dioxygenase
MQVRPPVIDSVPVIDITQLDNSSSLGAIDSACRQWGFFLQDDQPGLEVCRNGSWHLVPPRAGALVINLGDVVQVWSNDRYQAALHRVITHARRERYSVPFFLNPSYETRYEPLPASVDAQRPARYEAIQWREFRELRAAGDYADLGEEVQIAHHYRKQEEP